MGKHLLWHVFEYPLKEARKFCGQRLPLGRMILHRFVTEDGDLEFVPFESSGDQKRGEYLRGVHPVVRKLSSRNDRRRNPNRALTQHRSGERVLLISSDVSGVLTKPGHTFKGIASPNLMPLDYLKTELERVQAAQKRGIGVKSLALEVG